MREEKRLHIAIDIWGRTWGYDIIELTSGNSLHWTAYREDIKSHEDAALDGIEYILELFAIFKIKSQSSARFKFSLNPPSFLKISLPRRWFYM